MSDTHYEENSGAGDEAQATQDLIPEGHYRAKARAGSWGLGKTSTGKEQIAVLFDLPDLQRDIPWYGFFSDGAFDRTLESLRHMGWLGNDLTELENAGGGLDTNDVSITIKHELYEGRKRARVAWVNAAGGALLKQRLEGQELQSFAQRMKAKILQAGAGKPPPAAQAGAKAPPAAQRQAASKPASRPPEPPHTADDLPF